jgi:hypothetical protein
MASVDSKYNVTITLDIRDVKDGEQTEFSRTVQQYSDVPYEMMWQLQAVAIPALVEKLIGMGEPIAEGIAQERMKGKAEKAVGKQDDKFAR